MNTLQSRATITCVQERTAIKKLYHELAMLQDEYPGFEKWYFEKVVPEALSGSRLIFVAWHEDKPAGILILKDADEKKICTLRVMPEFRRIGVGHQLMDCAISALNTTHPIITVSDDHIQEFSKLLIKDYKFVPTEIHYGYYRENHVEYVFNGVLN